MTDTDTADTGALDLADLPQPERETTVAPDALETDGDNPNEQTDEMFGLLCENMRKRGWVGNAIVADSDGLIADGEHRWRAAQEIGLSEVPVKFYDLADADRRLWRQELNKISGEHDKKRDALEYAELLDAGKADEVDALVDAADENLDELLAEIRVDRSSKPLYEYDTEHNVYFEDCVEGMAERLDDDSVDCVITDPPYGIDFQSNNPDGANPNTPRFKTLSNDSIDDALSLFEGVCHEVRRVLKPNGHFYVFGRWDTYPAFAEVAGRSFGLRNLLVWVKNDWGMGDVSGNYSPRHELVLYLAVGDARGIDVSDHRPSNVLEYGTGAGKEYNHPTEKPVSLIADIMQNSTQPGDTICDPFMGSGTTAVAAIQNDRNYVGFEIDAENYKPVIERRISEAKRQMQSSENQPAGAGD